MTYLSMLAKIKQNLDHNGLSEIIFRNANGPGDRGSTPDRIIPKTQKMVLDAF